MTNTREKQVTVVKSQFERWKLTGVIALSNSDIKVVPQEVWNCGSSVTFLDLNCNLIQDIPESISGLSSLQKDSLMEISFHIPNDNTQFVGDENRPSAQI
ncbi:hypothetical protein L2E82_32570 [Cichorium intybus]|uniref:Uncharacterized protein n=1 Tax=Cichorium intybus TaxID=13427 RepID=A0ACB9BHX8_CICIN|nr:hypothetical protein L2E82_32570 [Cichorium intybus]